MVTASLPGYATAVATSKATAKVGREQRPIGVLGVQPASAAAAVAGGLCCGLPG